MVQNGGEPILPKNISQTVYPYRWGLVSLGREEVNEGAGLEGRGGINEEGGLGGGEGLTRKVVWGERRD